MERVKSIDWGKTHERITINEFEKASDSIVTKTSNWLHKSGFLKVNPNGLFLMKTLHIALVKLFKKCS